MDTHRASGLHGRLKNVSCTESDTCTTAYVFVDVRLFAVFSVVSCFQEVRTAWC